MIDAILLEVGVKARHTGEDFLQLIEVESVDGLKRRQHKVANLDELHRVRVVEFERNREVRCFRFVAGQLHRQRVGGATKVGHTSHHDKAFTAELLENRLGYFLRAHEPRIPADRCNVK